MAGVQDVMRQALAHAQRRVGFGGGDGEGIRELASVCIWNDEDDEEGHTQKKKKPNAPVDVNEEV
jgi:hypothetical protein